jgi:hypothetical protein
MVRVRKDDGNILEILWGAFEMEDFPETDKLKVLTKPFRMEEGDEFKFERIREKVKLNLDYTTWDQRALRFGVEVSPRTSIPDIVAEVQKRAKEPLEEARYYVMAQNSKIAAPPWLQSTYQLKPSCILATTVTIKTRNGDLRASVLTHHPEFVARHSIPRDP